MDSYMATQRTPGVIFAMVLGMLLCASPSTGHGHGKPLDDDMVRDAEHIKLHLKEQGMKADPEHMTQDETLFLFFTQHDLDNSTSLDGLELAKAAYHVANEHGRDSVKKKSADQLEKDVMERVDQELKDYDANNDGYVTWPEIYIGVRKFEAGEEAVKRLIPIK